jgi:plastocyanin
MVHVRRFIAVAAVLTTATLWAGPLSAVPASASGSLYTVMVDAQPTPGEPWAFESYFPHAIKVHQGDTITAAWNGTDFPHTATFVNTTNPDAWRQHNQGPSGPYTVVVPDSAVGGDDNELVFNPSVLFPSSFGCGTAAIPCSFDGTSVVSSGVLFSNPSAQPSFSVQVNAPVGHYSLLCLLHPGMDIPVDVVSPDQSIPSPAQVSALGAKEAARANAVDAPKADAQAQQVTTSDIGGGHTRWTISAGGFYKQVSANEYPDNGLTIRVGDELQVNGTEEIHTATFPLSAASTVPFTVSQCEVPGPDIPATSPADCASPSQFQIALNNQAVAPTPSNELSDPGAFVNGGLITTGQSSIFRAVTPGTYTMVCLVHGPMMSTTITVVGS